MRNLLIVTLFSFFVSCSTSNPKSKNRRITDTIQSFDGQMLIGEWEWEKNSESKDFSIKFYEDKNVIKGAYCYVLQYGEKMDCFEDGEYNFIIDSDFNEEGCVFEFKSGYGGTKGKGKIRIISKDEIEWEIKESPKGEYYCPTKAILRKKLQSSPQ